MILLVKFDDLQELRQIQGEAGILILTRVRFVRIYGIYEDIGTNKIGKNI
jgi:hypothetical protein